MADDVFSDQLQSDVTVDTLVGEGKKYTDVNALAKAYVNGDSFIEQLKRDNAQLRAEKDANKNTPNADGNQEQRQQADPPPNAEPPKPQNKDVDLRKLVSEELQNLDQSRRFETNVQEAANKMAEIYGSTQKAQEAVLQKARELGVSAEWLRDAAARSPQAFYATMGVNPNTPPATNRETPAPNSDVRLNNNQNSGTKNYSYFEDLRKTNKTQYYSAGVQAEMQRLAREKGDAFYT